MAAEDKQVLMQAAALSHTNITEFVFQQVLPSARKIVKANQQAQFSLRDLAMIADLLDNPPKPNKVNGNIIGCYSLTISTVDYTHLPVSLQKGLGHYAVPTFLLARLAVDQAYQGKGIGGTLLVKALARCKRVAEEVGGITA